MHAVGRPPPGAHPDVLAGDVAAHDAGDDDGREGEAVGDLCDDGGSRAEGGRLDVRPRVVVDDGADDDVEGGGDDLHEGERLGEVARVLELGAEGEEGDVAGVGEQNLEGGEHAGLDVGVVVHGDNVRGIRFCDADADHGDGDADHNGDAGDGGEVGDLLELAFEGEKQADDEAGEAEDDGAGAVIGENVEGDGESENVCRLDEDEDQDLCDAHDFSGDGAKHEEGGICESMGVGIS